MVKLSADGTALVYANYFGGGSENFEDAYGSLGTGIAVDGAGQAYVTGWTDRTDFPTRNALQPVFGGFRDTFITQLSADGATLLYSSYFGGGGVEMNSAIAVDSAGNAYLTGQTWSGDVPMHNALQPVFGGGTTHQVAVLPDLDGNGVTELAVLSRDAAGQTKTELRDAATGTLIRNLWFDHLDPLDLAVLPDLNGNGSPEVAVLGVPTTGGAQVLIKDSATKAVVSRLDF